MYNLLISAGVALLTFGLLLGPVGLSWWLAIPLALLAFVAVFVPIGWYVRKQVEAINNEVLKSLQAIQAQRITSKELGVQLLDKAVRDLKGALRFARWQVFLSSQISTAIGGLYFSRREFATAADYLEPALDFNYYFKNWEPLGMLAVCCLKRNKPERMKQVFEKAVMGKPKESLLWSLYAYCLLEAGEGVAAREVLEKGLKKLPVDTFLTDNLEAAQQGKRLKMDGYGDKWLQFQLESLGKLQKMQMNAMPGGMRRRIIRR